MTKQYETQDRARPFIFGDGNDKIVWLLATPTERIVAGAINAILTVLAFSPLGWAIYHNILKGTDWGLRVLGLQIWSHINTALTISPLGTVGLAVGGVYLVLQAYLMSRSGQSLGKMLVGIRVMSVNGRDAGFLQTVLLRKIVYNLIWVVLFGVVLSVLGLRDNFSVLNFMWIPYLACLSTLWDISANCRTLQDKLAGTAVVRAKPMIRPY